MNKWFQWVSLAVIGLLLAGILAILIDIAHNGIRVEHTGKVELAGMYDKVELTMSGPVRLVADGDGIPLRLSSENAVVVPLRFNPWTGRIEWGEPGDDR
ncbi:hypothetical protein DRJ24_04550 [Candidatus Acetothermia bacterium]|nr:MAG: hypothetical protein DRJ24_04550 [Candidatus Acetothermia bacterium]HHK66873.1 hypothetical protein [Candidatus Acetothermia bacterium]